MQRNAWLKLHAQALSFESDELDFYNQQLSFHGGYIYDARKLFVQDFLPLLEQYYQALSGGRETISIIYKSDLEVQPLLQWLQDGLQQDLFRQRTSRGIHKDELELALNEQSLKQFGSQGQKKSFLFAMKLAQYVYLYQRLGHRPILLLDDIFEKLDQQRIEALMRIIRRKEFGQVILTDTDAHRVQRAFGDDADVGVMVLDSFS
jgi:DNA replication and repair protein RecF